MKGKNIKGCLTVAVERSVKKVQMVVARAVAKISAKKVKRDVVRAVVRISVKKA
jgi:hypothetical protein